MAPHWPNSRPQKQHLMGQSGVRRHSACIASWSSQTGIELQERKPPCTILFTASHILWQSSSRWQWMLQRRRAGGRQLQRVRHEGMLHTSFDPYSARWRQPVGRRQPRRKECPATATQSCPPGIVCSWQRIFAGTQSKTESQSSCARPHTHSLLLL